MKIYSQSFYKEFLSRFMLTKSPDLALQEIFPWVELIILLQCMQIHALTDTYQRRQMVRSTEVAQCGTTAAPPDRWVIAAHERQESRKNEATSSSFFGLWAKPDKNAYAVVYVLGWVHACYDGWHNIRTSCLISYFLTYDVMEENTLRTCGTVSDSKTRQHPTELRC